MKFSIVMATYNAEKYLERALASIFCQTYPNYELIIQDGGSTDGTTAILEKNLPKNIWVSAPDNGIYDAWNKALTRATGDWVIFLGADDCFMGENVLVRCSHHMKRLTSNISFVYGAIAKGIDGNIHDLVNTSLMDVYRRFTANMGLQFPATFVRTALAKEHKFDPSYKIAGDFDFAAKLITHENIARIPVIVSYMEQGGLSSNAQTRSKALDERGIVLRKRILPKAQEMVLGCIKYYRNQDVSLENI